MESSAQARLEQLSQACQLLKKAAMVSQIEIQVSSELIAMVNTGPLDHSIRCRLSQKMRETIGPLADELVAEAEAMIRGSEVGSIPADVRELLDQITTSYTETDFAIAREKAEKLLQRKAGTTSVEAISHGDGD